MSKISNSQITGYLESPAKKRLKEFVATQLSNYSDIYLGQNLLKANAIEECLTKIRVIVEGCNDSAWFSSMCFERLRSAIIQINLGDRQPHGDSYHSDLVGARENIYNPVASCYDEEKIDAALEVVNQLQNCCEQDK
jgi:hypothetical protein